MLFSILRFTLLAWAVLGASLLWAYDPSHALWGEVLKEFRDTEGRVRYGELKKAVRDEAHPFNRYLKTLSSVSRAEYEAWTKHEQMSFLINAYNAFTVQWILKHYPTTSIKQTVGWFSNPWKQEFFSLLGGAIKSLDPIEHDWLRPKFQDARIHVAINCASISCPVLGAKPYTAKELNQQLDAAFRQFLADKTRNRYAAKEKVYFVSKIFDWFEEDFVKSFGSIAGAVKEYGPPEAGAALSGGVKIRYLDYDWNLNDALSAAEPSQPVNGVPR